MEEAGVQGTTARVFRQDGVSRQDGPTFVRESPTTKFAAFYLSNDSDLIANPLTLLGLGFGSMHVQLSERVQAGYRPQRELLFIMLSTAGSVLAVFWIFSSLPFERDVADPMLLARKTLAFCVAMCPPFYFCGRLLSIIFRAESGRIGTFYAADFVGAALGGCSIPLLLHWVGLGAVIVVLFSVQLIALVAANETRSSRLHPAGRRPLLSSERPVQETSWSPPSGPSIPAGSPGS